MGRGRNRSVSDERLLLEMLLNRDRAVFGPEIAEHIDVGPERVRQLMGDLEELGYVDAKKVSNANLYTLTDEGFAHLAEHLREMVD